VRYSLDPEREPKPDELYWAHNLVPLTPGGGPYIRRKKDFYYPIGSGVNDAPLFVHTYEKPGASPRVLVGLLDSTARGALYEAQASAGDVTLSVVLSTAVLSAAGVNLRGGKPANIGGQVVFGAEPTSSATPFVWDGTSGGGISALTNAPLGASMPTIMAGKIFFRESDGYSITWSEELANNTGYNAGGFSNSWSLTQQGQSTIRHLYGSNEGIYYFREKSIGLIRGAVTTDFAAAAQHDDVALELGVANQQVLDLNSRFWFFDTEGRPWMLPRGGRPVPIWQHASLLWPQARSANAAGQGIGWAPMPEFGAVLGFVNGFDSLVGGATGFLFDDSSGDLLSIWTCTQTPLIVGAATSPCLLDYPRAVFLTSGTGAAPPKLAYYSDPKTVTGDEYAEESPTQTYRLLTHPLGDGDGSLNYWDQLDVEYWLGRDANSASGSPTPEMSSSEVGFQYGVTNPLSTLTGQSIAATATPKAVRKVWGLGRELRWAQCGVSASGALGLQCWGVNRVTLKGFKVPIHPNRS
jgi:hypothetical protein